MTQLSLYWKRLICTIARGIQFQIARFPDFRDKELLVSIERNYSINCSVIRKQLFAQLRKTIIDIMNWNLREILLFTRMSLLPILLGFILAWSASKTHQTKLFYSAYYQTLPESAYLDDMYTFIYMMRHSKEVYGSKSERCDYTVEIYEMQRFPFLEREIIFIIHRFFCRRWPILRCASFLHDCAIAPNKKIQCIIVSFCFTY